MNKLMKSFMLGVLLSGVTPAIAFAWDGVITGKIETIHVTGGGNYGFRVTLRGSPAACGNANGWSYLNDTDSNYKVYVAVLLLAKAQQSSVTIYSNKDASGYCNIGYIYAS